ncbi:MAG TPA: hypothetical protein VIU85_06420, partial [Chthoniobacterales bacterium]
MKSARGAASLIGLAMLFWLVNVDLAQPPPGYPRPPGPPPQQQPQIPRALPVDDNTPPPAAEAEQQEKRQLEYASDL